MDAESYHISLVYFTISKIRILKYFAELFFYAFYYGNMKLLSSLEKPSFENLLIVQDTLGKFHNYI